MIRASWFRAAALAAALAGQYAGMAAAQTPPRADLVRESFKIETTIDGKAHTLEAVAVLPPGEGPFPLAIVAHGTPRGGLPAYATVSPMTFVPQLEEFARRGYAAVVALRRGFGQSSGPAIEFTPGCDASDHVASVRESGKDMRAIAAALRQRPKIDGSRILAVGISTGGLAVLSMGTEPVDGLMRAIAFAPVRGSRGTHDICNVNRLVEAVAGIGAASRVPTHWIYAANDSFASPALARRLFDAYRGAGGVGEMIELPAWERDGHDIFSRAGIPDWRPVVDGILSQAALPNWPSPPDDPPWPDLPPPPGLPPAAQAGWQQYLRAPPNKAFAANAVGNWAYRTGYRTPEAARDAALLSCHGRLENCRIVAVDDAYAR
jgi:dienelactone hydrolase